MEMGMAIVRKIVGKFRHWKQRFNPDAGFIWRKAIIWDGEQTVPGSLCPESLTSNRGKLRSLWDAGWIELAKFDPEQPTKQDPLAHKVEIEAAKIAAAEKADAEKAEKAAAEKAIKEAAERAAKEEAEKQAVERAAKEVAAAEQVATEAADKAIADQAAKEAAKKAAKKTAIDDLMGPNNGNGESSKSNKAGRKGSRKTGPKAGS